MSLHILYIIYVLLYTFLGKDIRNAKENLMKDDSFEQLKQRLANNIKKYRELKNLSKKELAKNAGVSEKLLYKLENLQSDSTSIVKIIAIAGALNVKAKDLFS